MKDYTLAELLEFRKSLRKECSDSIRKSSERFDYITKVKISEGQHDECAKALKEDKELQAFHKYQEKLRMSINVIDNIIKEEALKLTEIIT